MPELQRLSEGRFFLPIPAEEVASSRSYPQGFSIQSVQEQVKALLALDPFKDLDASHVEELARGNFPDGAEGWGVIPKLSKVAKSYHKAMEIALDLHDAGNAIANQRYLKSTFGTRLSRVSFVNQMSRDLTEDKLRLTERTRFALARLEKDTPGDFLVMPFQFGGRYSGRSVRCSRSFFIKNEFGLGVYEIAVLLLTHPGRLKGHLLQIGIHCAGVEIVLDKDINQIDCPYFDFCNKYYDENGANGLRKVLKGTMTYPLESAYPQDRDDPYYVANLPRRNESSENYLLTVGWLVLRSPRVIWGPSLKGSASAFLV